MPNEFRMGYMPVGAVAAKAAAMRFVVTGRVGIPFSFAKHMPATRDWCRGTISSKFARGRNPEKASNSGESPAFKKTVLDLKANSKDSDEGAAAAPVQRAALQRGRLSR